MHRIKYISFVVAFVCICFVGCYDKAAESSITSMNSILDSKAFESRIDSLRIIPLQGDSHRVLGSMLEVSVANNEYYVVDGPNGKIYRYSSDGSFLNQIGHKGKSAKEYLTIQNIQVSGDTITVFSFPGRVIRFLKDGRYIESDSYKELGRQSWLNNKQVLTYYGYQSNKKHRYVVIDKGRERYRALKTTGRVMMYESMDPIFFEVNETVLMLDSYSNVVYSVTATSCEPYLVFDFGRYSIPLDFFHAADIYTGAEMLLNSEFAYINRYVENNGYKVVVVVVQKPDNVKVIYGISTAGRWNWYDLGSPKDNPLSGTMKTLGSNCMYHIIETSRLSSLFGRFGKKTKCEYSISQLVNNSDYVIAKVYFH